MPPGVDPSIYIFQDSKKTKLKEEYDIVEKLGTLSLFVSFMLFYHYLLSHSKYPYKLILDFLKAFVLPLHLLHFVINVLQKNV